MKLEDIEKICNEATTGPWDVRCFAGSYKDAYFIAAARDLMPKLLAVAKQAKIQHECGDPYYAHAEIGKALEDLERE